MSGSPHPAAAIDAQSDLRLHWSAFCDADQFDGVEDFAGRMEAAGLVMLVPVTAAALDEAFAAERGIEPGGLMWVLTEAGHAAMRARAAL